MNRLVIVGAGGHGKVVADIALKNGYTDIRFVDDNSVGDCMGFPIIGKCCDLENLSEECTEFVIGIGNNAIRKLIAEKYELNWATLIHPSAQIGFNVEIGKGTVVMANTAINTCSKIGEHCIINTGSIVEHDCVLENYTHVSPNAALGGTVHVGSLTHVGIGATVKNNIEIYSECTIGAGAVVIRNINVSGTYVGVPANNIKRNV
jgi:sugar O-acyltransferase (sialic acid O-acetyltransferase NeuD family)